MLEALPFFISGCVFGLAGGFTPGPTSTLVVAQTLRFGLADGAKVAVAPALTDAPIIVLAVLLIGRLAQIEPLVGGVSLLGAMFLVYLAIENFRVRRIELGGEDIEPRSLQKGFMANLLNPHPYLFWFVIGAPTLLKAAHASVVAAVLFIIGLYMCLIGAKLLVAALVARSRSFLNSRAYVNVNRVLGIALAAFALLFLRDGLRYLGVIS